MKRIVLAVALVLAAALPARADEAIVTYKSLAPDTALELARAALNQCRKDGYQVAVVVLDRSGIPLVVLRDRFAPSLALRVARAKASTALGFTRDTGELGKMLQAGEINREIVRMRGVLMAAGGLVVQAGGSTLGAVGAAGAPGSDKDEVCAKAGLAAVQDKLEF